MSLTIFEDGSFILTIFGFTFTMGVPW